MAISRANIGQEIKMSGNKKVTKYKKGIKPDYKSYNFKRFLKTATKEELRELV